MRKRVERLVRQYTDARRRRLRFEALMTALSVLVTGGVFWQLRRNGTAISDETAVPAAELAEAGETVVETDADPPDETARSGIAEEPEDWESALPVFTDESPQQRIAAIAASQLGYTEGSAEVLLSDDGTSRAGYTRYGAWYGNPYGEWNTMFTYFCMYYAGIEKTEIPYGSGCWAWYETLTEQNMIKPCGEEQAGDIVFFDTDADGEPDRTGIVTGTEETEEGTELKTIEGNCEGSVAEKQYLRGGSEMLGVLSADVYVTDLPEGVMLIDYSGDTESGIHVAAQAAAGVFPEGTVMKAADVPQSDAMQAASEAHGENAQILDAVAVDISFYNAEGEEIEPAAGESVSVQITLPEEKQLAEGVHTLVHVDNEGESALVNGANVTADGAVFEAESFSVYIVTSLGRKIEYQDGETITLKVGESFTLYAEDLPLDCDLYYKIWYNENEYISPSVWNLDSRNALIESGDYHITKFPNPEGGGTERHELTFTALKPTPNNITLPRILPPENNGNSIYYNVRITGSPFMVETSHGFKDSDRIREYLDIYDGTTYGLEMPYHLVEGHEGYVLNGSGRPYQLPVGDTVTFYVDTASADDTFTYGNRNADNNGWVAGDTIREIVSSETTPLGNGMYRHQVTLKGKAAGYVQVTNSGTDEEFWIRIWQPDTGGNTGQKMNHADMEIADGGTYTISSTDVDEDGNTIVEVKVYQADVTFVNDAYLYRKNNEVVQHYTSEMDPNYPLYTAKVQRNADGSIYYDSNNRPVFLDANGNPLARDSSGKQILKDGDNWLTVPDENYPVGDYEQFGVPGGTQYEMTSAWIMNVSAKQWTKPFDATEVDHATFNVNLHLTPKKKYTYKLDSDGNMVPQVDPFNPDNNWDGADDNLTSYDPEGLLFKLNHQDVLDAMNKCPVNNGLDFTAKAEFTVLQLPVQKKLLNGSLKDKSFTFDVIDLNATPLDSTIVENNRAIADSTVSDENGLGMLSNMRFFEEGTYYFELKERIPELEDREGYNYDDSSIFLRVDVVKEDETGFLVALPTFLKDNGSGDPSTFPKDTERKEAEFTNYKGYELPQTGGTGPLPYLAGGMILISAAFVLPLIRRRKEDEFDS